MLTVESLIIFLVLGLVVGFMAGLLGIGGGGIMVPVLTTVFLSQGMSPDKVVHLALGSSMASIILTSIASLRAHHAKGAVIWSVVKKMSPGVVLGAFLGTFLAAYLSTQYLAIFFAVFMGYVAVQMFVNKQPTPCRRLPGILGMSAASTGIGIVSALVAIGGGSLTVPFLAWSNINIKTAIGTSAAIGFPIAVAGALGYLINGWSLTIDEQYTVGFVYVPAVAAISVLSYFTAPLGARLAHRLPVALLKKIFSILLVALSVKMLISIL